MVEFEGEKDMWVYVYNNAFARTNKSKSDFLDYMGWRQMYYSNDPKWSTIKKSAEFFDMNPSEFIKLGE